MNAQQLKNAILQEAIEGRLVPQDPNDEPASALLDRIRKEKARLVKEGKLKKKDLEETPITEDEKSFEIPESWEWVRLGEITYNHGQKIPTDDFSYIDIGSIDNRHQCLDSNDNIIKAKDAPSRARKIVQFGDVIYATVRPYLHNICIIDRNFSKEPIASTGFAVLSCINGLFNKFLFYYLLSPVFDAYANDGDNSKGVAYPAINDKKLYNGIVPLPPLAEQQRIVAKIEELLPKVEEYGKAQEALDKLNAELPERLKKSILQEAIEGRLVPQDPNDEPASVLLDRIRKEKAQLVKAGKLKKKDLEETPITEEEKPFEIPEGWEWCHLGEIVDMQMGKTPPRGEPLLWQNGKESWVSISDMKDYGHIQTTKEKISEYSVKKVFKKKSPKGTLLMSFKLTIGRTSILDIPAFHNEAIISIYPYVDTNNSFRNYLFYLLPLLSILGDSKDAIKGKTLNSTSLNNLLIPLPPLAEQQRIVAKIEELFGAVNALP